MPTYLVIESNVNNPNVVTILFNDLINSTGYHSMNPRKADVSDIRHNKNELSVEVIFMSGVKTQYISPTPIWLANYPKLANQGILPVDSVGGATVTTCEQLEQELLKVLA